MVDDHPLMREALRMAIRAEEGLEYAGEATNGREAVELIDAVQPDVIVMDLLMPQGDGLAAIAALRDRWPDARILVLTSSTEDRHILAAVQAGAMGYLSKDVGREELIQAIRDVGQGQAYLPPQAALKLLHELHHPAMQAQSQLDRLTTREKEVLRYLCRGLANQEIAEAMFVSEATVRSHIFHILGKLGLHKRREAVAFAARHIGWLSGRLES